MASIARPVTYLRSIPISLPPLSEKCAIVGVLSDMDSEFVKKQKDLLDYVIVHEMIHLIEPTHSARFVSLPSEHFPTWREARAELNELSLTAEKWRE